METLNVHFIWIGSAITQNVEKFIYDKALILYTFFERSYCLKVNVWTDKSYGQPIKNPELIRLKRHLEVKYLNPIPLIIECAGTDYFKFWEILKGPVPFKSFSKEDYEHPDALDNVQHGEWSKKDQGRNLVPFLAAAADLIKVLCLLHGQGKNLYLDIGLEVHDEFKELQFKKFYPEFLNKCQALHDNLSYMDYIKNTEKAQYCAEFEESSRDGMPFLKDYNAIDKSSSTFDKLKMCNLKADPDFWQEFKEAHPCILFNGQGIPKFRADVDVAAASSVRNKYEIGQFESDYLKTCETQFWLFDLQILYSGGTMKSINFFKDVLKELQLDMKRERYRYYASKLKRTVPPVFRSFVGVVLNTAWLLEAGEEQGHYKNGKTGVKEKNRFYLSHAGDGMPMFGGLYFKNRDNPKNPMVDYKKTDALLKLEGKSKTDDFLSSLPFSHEQTNAYLKNKTHGLIQAINTVKYGKQQMSLVDENAQEESKEESKLTIL